MMSRRRWVGDSDTRLLIILLERGPKAEDKGLLRGHGLGAQV